MRPEESSALMGDKIGSKMKVTKEKKSPRSHVEREKLQTVINSQYDNLNILSNVSLQLTTEDSILSNNKKSEKSVPEKMLNTPAFSTEVSTDNSTDEKGNIDHQLVTGTYTQPPVTKLDKTDSKVYQCAECSNSYTRKSDLTRHYRKHNNERNYLCKGKLANGDFWGCGKDFLRSDALKRHFKSHNGKECIRPLILEKFQEEAISDPAVNDLSVKVAMENARVLMKTLNPSLRDRGRPEIPNKLGTVLKRSKKNNGSKNSAEYDSALPMMLGTDSFSEISVPTTDAHNRSHLTEKLHSAFTSSDEVLIDLQKINQMTNNAEDRSSSVETDNSDGNSISENSNNRGKMDISKLIH